MPTDIFVLVYLDKDGRLKANGAVYLTESQAVAGVKLLTTVKQVEAWIMAFPDPRQVAAND